MIESGVASRPSEVRLMNGDGRESVWSRGLTPINFEVEGRNAKANFVLFSAIEIAEQIKAREELERLNHLKDQFFSLASHELRTPLVPLMGYSEALMRLISQPVDDPAKEQKIAQMVGKFRGQLKHLSRLTDDLLDVARLQSGKFSLQEEPVNLAEVVEQAVEGARLISHARTIQFEAPKMDRPLIVHGDKERLAQVMNNLLNNAIKYAPQSERIDVRLGRARGAKRMAQIEVQDYGQGIAEEDMEMMRCRFSPHHLWMKPRSSIPT